MGTLPSNWLDTLNWGTSAGGAAGLSETTSTLGQDRQDVRVPPDTYHIGNLQLARYNQLLLLMSQYMKGGTRLRVLEQTSNPFGIGEAGFWTDTSHAPKFTDVLGNITTLGSGGGGSIDGLLGAYQAASSTAQNIIGLTTTLGPVLIRNNATPIATTLFGVQDNAGTGKLFDVLKSGSAVHQGVETSGSPTAWLVEGAAHTSLAASAEAIDIYYDLSRTVQFSTGAITTQRAVVYDVPTYGFVGASTITNAATVAIGGAPVAGTNATLTNSYALWTQAGLVGHEIDSVGTANTVGQTLFNATAAGAGAQQFSPMLEFFGNGWKTNATAASQTVKAAWQLQPVQGAANPTWNLLLLGNVNAAGYSSVLQIDSSGGITNPISGQFNITSTQANSGTNTGIVFNNSVSLSGTTNIADFQNAGSSKIKISNVANIEMQTSGSAIRFSSNGAGCTFLSTSGNLVTSGSSAQFTWNSSGQFIPASTNAKELGLTGSQFIRTWSRRYHSTGTATVAGDYALSAGWGSTASITVTSNSNDTHGTILVTSSGTGQGANPTITFTFKDGTWTLAPFAVVVPSGGTGTQTHPTWAITATVLTITWPGTPVAGSTYQFDYHVLGA